MCSNTVTFSYSVFAISGIMKVSVSEKSLGFDYPGNHKNLIQQLFAVRRRAKPTVTRSSSYFCALTKQPGELSSGSNSFQELTVSVTIGQSVNCGFIHSTDHENSAEAL